MSRRGDGGQAMPLVLAAVALAVVLMLALVPLARAAADRAQAQTAADAAALAGAAEGEPSARRIASVNGAQLIDWRAEDGQVWVAVQVGEAVARAKARRVPPGGNSS